MLLYLRSNWFWNPNNRKMGYDHPMPGREHPWSLTSKRLHSTYQQLNLAINRPNFVVCNSVWLHQIIVESHCSTFTVILPNCAAFTEFFDETVGEGFSLRMRLRSTESKTSIIKNYRTESALLPVAGLCTHFLGLQHLDWQWIHC